MQICQFSVTDPQGIMDNKAFAVDLNLNWYLQKYVLLHIPTPMLTLAFKSMFFNQVRGRYRA